jgi:hypothetical protein
MGGHLLTFGHALLGEDPGQSDMLVVHLALRPLSAFGLDGTAKVSVLTSGADPRSTGPTTLSSRSASFSTRNVRSPAGPLNPTKVRGSAVAAAYGQQPTVVGTDVIAGGA